jgi:hypothetical protein
MVAFSAQLGLNPHPLSATKTCMTIICKIISALKAPSTSDEMNEAFCRFGLGLTFIAPSHPDALSHEDAGAYSALFLIFAASFSRLAEFLHIPCCGPEAQCRDDLLAQFAVCQR